MKAIRFMNYKLEKEITDAGRFLYNYEQKARLSAMSLNQALGGGILPRLGIL